MIALATASLSSAALTALTVAFVAMGCIASTFGIYLLVLSLGAFFYSVHTVQGTPRKVLAVLIPAHDESLLIARCIRSLRNQTYPNDLYEIVVVADNCTDDTASVAAAAGANRVMTRDAPDARGKGRALRWAMDRLLSEESAPDALVIVDADSIAAPGFLTALVQPFAAGAPAVQGEYLLYGDGTTGAELRVSAFLLINRVRLAGRAAFGLSAHLVGNGMLLSRDLLLAHPWTAFTSAEDLEYTLELRLSGVDVAFAGNAALRAPTAPNSAAAAEQQLRWEGGKAYLARKRIPGLIGTGFRERRPALLGIAFELAVPPLGLLAAIVVSGLLVGVCLTATGTVATWVLGPWLVAAVSIPLFVLIGLRAGRAHRAGYLALIRAPLFIAAKPLRIYRVLSFRADTWVRTERAPDSDVRTDV